MNLRIGIVGSHSVGKTTLARKLAKELNTTLIEEQIRISSKKFDSIGFKNLNQIISSAWYPHFMFDILINQLQKEALAKNGFISDRTTLDYYAYYKMLSNDPPEVQKTIEDLLLPRFPTSYDLILYLPITFEITNDGYRSTDSDEQQRVDMRIQELLKPFQNVVILYENTREDRFQKALDAIQRYQQGI